MLTPLSVFHGGSVGFAGEAQSHAETRPVVHTHHYAVFEVGPSQDTIARTTWQEHWLNPYPMNSIAG